MFDPARVRLEPLGETAWILRELGDVEAWTLAEALTGARGVVEATSAYETVGVYTEAPLSEVDMRRLLEGLTQSGDASQRRHEIPVCYAFGPDLEEVAGRLNRSLEAVIDLHTSQPYRCYAVGFSPGFPFLGYLPKALQGIPRRSSPRASVPAGSVGITGRQTGVYPSSSPGGWALIGRTPLCLVNLADAYFPIRAGDEVRFRSIDEAEFERMWGERL